MYKKIKDTEVWMLWECNICDASIEVGPGFYQDNGTPTCKKCGEDMGYIETQIKMPRIVIFTEGAVVQDAMSNMPAQVRIIDYNVSKKGNAKTIRLPEGGERQKVCISKFNLDGIEDMEPFFRQKDIK